MVYLSEFHLPSSGQEGIIYNRVVSEKGDTALRSSIYPLGIFRYRIEAFSFADTTIFYGGNGTGKSTAINVIARRLQALTLSLGNESDFFSEYVSYSHPIFAQGTLLSDIRIRRIASDDVFAFINQKRNEQQDRAKMMEMLNEEYLRFRDEPIGNYDSSKLEEWNRRRMAHKLSRTQYIKDIIGKEEPKMSNGECAMQFFTNAIVDNSIVFLDEPENSLSAEWQVKLAEFLRTVPRGLRCQLIIATHSPFLLALPNARIYDFETEYKEPIQCKRWTELKNVQIYRNFFLLHEDEF